jgi:Uma2 family endonuclease
MTTTLVPPSSPQTSQPRTAADLLHSLGDIPPERVLMHPAPGTATEADLVRMVETKESLCELVDGTLVEKAVGFEEGLIAAIVIRILGQFVTDQNLGMVGASDTMMRMLGGNVRLPDVAFLSWSRLNLPRGAIPTVSPDLAIEILSPANTKKEMRRKREEYFAGGTLLVWEIDPKMRTANIFTDVDVFEGIPREGVLQGRDVVPGFSLPLHQLFADVDRAFKQ